MNDEHEGEMEGHDPMHERLFVNTYISVRMHGHDLASTGLKETVYNNIVRYYD